MAVALIQNAFSAGEIAPSLFGRTDLQKYRYALSTCRNMFVNYRGGASSRAGTHYVGTSKTPGNSLYAPRLIPFKFNLTQAYVLEFGNFYMRIIFQGAYVVEAAVAITGITKSLPAIVSSAGTVTTGDEIFISGVQGMTQVNGRFFLVGTVIAGAFSLKNLDGSDVDSLGYDAYTSGGTYERVLTVTSPYAIADLPLLKYTQSADVMSLTHNSYAPRDLARLSATNWTITTTTFGAVIAAPTSSSATPSVTSGTATSYQYVVTAISSASAEESIASPIASVTNSVDIGAVAGTITVNWSAVTGAKGYNIYRSPAAYNTSVPVGVIFGFAGNATSTSFIDTNIVPDFTFSPPLALNPFSGSSNWPGVVSYFQQRRVYAATINAPDTYFMSKPGNYTNFDSAFPTNDGDSIIGTPWAQQVDGIQFLLPMPGGLVAFTGDGAWQITGAGSANVAITPANQNANPQAQIGSSAQVPPLAINYDILYVQSKGSIVRDLVYNFYFNIYTSSDITILSSHLFTGHTISQWAYAEEPFKLIWAVRDDGILLCLTYLKDQDVYAWSRHDTDGIFVSIASVSEPPVDAVYVVVKRLIDGVWTYYIERFDDRLWNNVEEIWAVDSGLSLVLTEPNATLLPSSAIGGRNIGSVNMINGGTGYTTASVSIDDSEGGAGSGATFSASISSGSITSIAVLTGGAGYSDPTTMRIDGDGTNAKAQAVITNIVAFNATNSVFSASNIGDVIRVGGGQATITSYNSPTGVMANITVPITATIPNDPAETPLPAPAGTWTLSTPVDELNGLDHLEGKLVSILADGSVQTPQTVVEGAIALGTSASSITVGLPFIAQLQTPYLDVPGGATIQGRRKLIPNVTVRLDQSRGIQVGVNQPDASVQPNGATVPWANMQEVAERGNSVLAGVAIPLFTGDTRLPVAGSWAKGGQISVQQIYPLACNCLAVIPETEVGDTPG